MFRKIKIISFICFLLFSISNTGLVNARAEVKQVTITRLSETKDLVVSFSFDIENVDITFISPSGNRLSKDSSQVEMADGELWATYRVKNAEPGEWKVEYDLQFNHGIEYSIIEDNYGLWIQYLNVNLDGDSAELRFQADYEGDNVYYSYEVTAVSTSDPDNFSKVANGSARANDEEEKRADLSRLSSDEYVLKLDVYYDYNGSEVFDSVTSDPFTYTNPNEPKEIEDFKVKIDMNSHICLVDWSEFKKGGYDKYKLSVVADGEKIYGAEIERQVDECGVLFSEGTKNIEIKLSCMERDVWSAYKTKAVSLENEYIKNKTGDVTSSAQLEIEYRTTKDRPLYVKINEEEGNYSVKESGSLSFDLNETNNEVYAELELDNLVFFIIDGSVYCDVTPPTITIFDNIDGKTFYTDSVTILGKVTGADTITISGETVEADENGTFSYESKLAMGENVIEITAGDANGNSASRTLTLYRGGALYDATEGGKGLLGFLPMMISGFVSLIIIIFSIIFLKKKDKTRVRERELKVYPFVLADIVFGIADVVLLWQFISRQIFSNSVEFMEIAEKSVVQAAQYIKSVKMFGILTIVGADLLILSIVLTVYAAKRKNKKKM